MLSRSVKRLGERRRRHWDLGGGRKRMFLAAVSVALLLLLLLLALVLLHSISVVSPMIEWVRREAWRHSLRAAVPSCPASPWKADENLRPALRAPAAAPPPTPRRRSPNAPGPAATTRRAYRGSTAGTWDASAGGACDSGWRRTACRHGVPTTRRTAGGASSCLAVVGTTGPTTGTGGWGGPRPQTSSSRGSSRATNRLGIPRRRWGSVSVWETYDPTRRAVVRSNACGPVAETRRAARGNGTRW